VDAARKREAPRDRSALPLTVPLVLALAVWGAGLWRPAPAGPPPDPLALELRRFRALTDDRERIEAIRRFGKVQDPRVVVVLMEVVQAELAKERASGSDVLLMFASAAVVDYHIPKDEWLPTKYWNVATIWWEKHEAEVRRQAAALPR
jgi:hypothetical protein